MTSRTESFDVSGPPRIEVSLRAGDVIIREADGDAVTVALSGDDETVETTQIEATTGTVSVRSGHQKHRWLFKTMDVVITTPPGGIVRVNLGAGDVAIAVRLESVNVKTGAGDVHLNEAVGDVRVKIAAGDLTIVGSVDDAVLTSASGDIHVDIVRDVVVHTASGTIDLGTVTNTAKIRAASGDVDIHEFKGVDLDIKTMSGDAVVGLVAGMTVDVKVALMSGEFRSTLTPSDGEKKHRMSLTMKSFSGNATLRRPW
ncbi:MAG: DUF4097 family beta strand repeat-containing protein [Actinomycetota bacterium]|nr:DUF4097 family beta strand repeat-containing protein [Actinomycetota bacterium]